MISDLTPLPIDALAPRIAGLLGETGAVVLSAATGSGKTTRLPLYLLDAPWLGCAKILMLEPRRVATRHAALRLAEQLGEAVGERAGYAMRLERRVGPRTQIEVLTEGTYLRRLQADPELAGVGLVIFDELHERSLEVDLALALTIEARRALRPDLKLLTMSATLAATPVARLLDDAPIVEAPGRLFAIETRHLPGMSIADAVRLAHDEVAGDILAFLPGAREIRDAAAAPAHLTGIEILPLHASLDREAQERALRPSARRKVVLATDIAQTSLTIEGIEAVVDSGLARRPRFSARTGMSRLETVTISRAAAEQRRGRAGRLGPGRCYRLWSIEAERGMAPDDLPEIMEADLMPLALELAAWGTRDAHTLPWLTPPPEGPLAAARRGLAELGALDADLMLTPHGRAMIALPTHPRLAHMMLAARDDGMAPTAIAIAALLSGRDPWRDELGADLPARLTRMQHGAMPQDLRRLQGQLARALGASGGGIEPEHAGTCLSRAYPDRIAKRLTGSTYKLASGRAAGITHGPDAAFLAVAEVEDRGPVGRIRLAAALVEAELRARHAVRIERQAVVAWDAKSGKVQAQEVEMLGAIELARRPLRTPEPAAVQACLLGAIASDMSLLPLAGEALALLARIRYLAMERPGSMPDLGEERLRATLGEWLGPYLAGLSSAAELAALDFASILSSMLDRQQHDALQRLAPSRFRTPLGREVAIDYAAAVPTIAVPLQEMLGTATHPCVLDGVMPLAVALLSPAARPIQVTRDLPGFWRGSYAELRKEMRGRYPKHPWPEEPISTPPWRPGMPRR